MRIAINIRLIRNEDEQYENYTKELINRWAAQYSDNQFLVIAAKEQQPFAAGNIAVQLIPAKSNNIISLRYWHDVKLSAAAKRWKADIILHMDGICSLTTSIPQVLFVHDLAFLHHPSLSSKLQSSINKSFQKKFLQKTSHIVTQSAFNKQDIIRTYKIGESKTSIITTAAPSVTPLSYEQREQLKGSFADGREFFIVPANIYMHKNSMQVLKAFSYFKKWQQSNMKLLLLGKAFTTDAFLQEKLQAYKYREDVITVPELTETKQSELMAAAYGIIYTSLYEGLSLPLLQAMQNGVAVITSPDSNMAEIAGNTALYATPDASETIGREMIQLYKDEQLRSNMITLAQQQMQHHQWPQVIESWNETLQKITSI